MLVKEKTAPAVMVDGDVVQAEDSSRPFWDHGYRASVEVAGSHAGSLPVVIRHLQSLGLRNLVSCES